MAVKTHVTLGVALPTYRRPDPLRRVLAGLAQQADGVDELLIGLDGPENQTPDPVIPPPLRAKAHLIRRPKCGSIAMRHHLLRAARSRFLLWLNDDGEPLPTLIDAHRTAHATGSSNIGVGRQDWAEPADLFDQMVQSTDLVFFPPELRDRAGRPPGYRDCYGLNLSFPREAALAAGGVPDHPEPYGYDDLALAWDLIRGGCRAVDLPEARVLHHHRYGPSEVHQREYRLGRSAFHWAWLRPAFARDLFGRDITAAAFLSDVAASQRLARRDACRIEAGFLAWPDLPVDAVPNAVLPRLAEHWLPLKRWLWRQGVLDAAAGVADRWGLLRDGAWA